MKKKWISIKTQAGNRDPEHKKIEMNKQFWIKQKLDFV